MGFMKSNLGGLSDRDRKSLRDSLERQKREIDKALGILGKSGGGAKKKAKKAKKSKR